MYVRHHRNSVSAFCTKVSAPFVLLSHTHDEGAKKIIPFSCNVHCTQRAVNLSSENKPPMSSWQAVHKANCQGQLGTGALPAAIAHKATYCTHCITCRHEVVSLLDAMQQALEQRAATADVASQPQPYDVLFDFYCMRSNFKAAATAQYALACRLSDARVRVPQWLHLRATALCKPNVPASRTAIAQT